MAQLTIPQLAAAIPAPNTVAIAQHLTFSLGGVVLNGFEVSGSFEIGHDVLTVTHDNLSPSGQAVRQVQTMGAFPVPTKWSGTLWYDTALTRMQTLDQMCVNQTQVPWQYGPLTFQVIIKSFKATVKYQYEINYEMELIVISSNLGSVAYASNSSVPYNVGVDAQYQATNQYIQAMVAADVDLAATITDNWLNVVNFLVSNYPLADQPYNSILVLLGMLDQVTSSIETYAAPLYNTAILEADLAKLNASIAALNSCGLFKQNIEQLVGNGPYVQTLANFTGNLFAVAAQYYPGSSPDVIAPAIATANTLTDFWVYAPINLVLPPVFS